MARQVIILMGQPGAGKGTQGELLSDKLGLYYLETAKVGERIIAAAREDETVEIEGRQYSLNKQKEIWKAGKLWDPPFVVWFMENRIKELFEMGEGLILAGSPRTLYEVERLMPFLADLYGKESITIILLEVSAKESIFRNSHRRICQLMRHPILYSEETKNLTKCPLDGSALVRREGLDDPETIKVRLKTYEKETLPLIDFFKQNSFEVKKVNGQGTVAEVFERNLKTLNV